MRFFKTAQREAYALVSETCPHVDAALDAAAAEIKRQTGALREALIEALQRALEAEEKAEDLKREVERLTRELNDARDS